MCSSAPTPPTPPDPYAVSSAQTTSNINTGIANAGLNRVNQTGPLGSSTYSITGYNPDGTPIYAQSTQMSPQEQQILAQYLQGQQGAGAAADGIASGLGSLGTPANANGLPGITSQVTNGAGGPGAIQDAENAAYNTQAQYFKPQQAEQTEQLRDQLTNQGLDPNSEAAQHAMGDLTRQQTFQTQAAQNAAVTAGQQEQNTLFGQGLQGAGLQNASNAQALGQMLQLRDQPISELGALQGEATPQMPQFQSVPGATVNPTDVSGNVYNSYQGQLNTYNAQMGAANSQTAGLFSLGAAGIKGLASSPTALAAIGLSDERAKKNIKHVGHTPGGHKVYDFDYKKDFKLFGLGGGGKQRGVIAQEVEKKQPEAVHRMPGGMRVVDYRKVA